MNRHTAYTDPGAHAALLDALPADVDAIAAAVRNVIVHYRASGVTLPADRYADIDLRWVSRILDTDQARHGQPLTVARAVEDRTLGCCRDFTLLTVAALRQHGILARSRVGFCGYFDSGWHTDHVVVELTAEPRTLGARLYDAELVSADHPFDTTDIPRGIHGFASAADVWTAYRRGEVDVDTFGVGPGLPYFGAWFVANYVLIELAHRMGDELLLWDGFGAMAIPDGPDPVLVDDVAIRLIAADRGDATAEASLAAWYMADPRLRPGPTVVCYSPTGVTSVVDLTTRTANPAPDAFTIALTADASRTY